MENIEEFKESRKQQLMSLSFNDLVERLLTLEVEIRTENERRLKAEENLTKISNSLLRLVNTNIEAGIIKGEIIETRGRARLFSHRVTPQDLTPEEIEKRRKYQREYQKARYDRLKAEKEAKDKE